MSYCRNNGEDSDIYVIGTGMALECCGCSFMKSAYFMKYSDLIDHMREHQKRGEKVPTRAFLRLREEAKEHKNLYPATMKSRLPRNIRKTKIEMNEQTLWKELQPYNKEHAKQVLETFQRIYGRRPSRLERDGLVKAGSIEYTFLFMGLEEK